MKNAPSIYLTRATQRATIVVAVVAAFLYVAAPHASAIAFDRIETDGTQYLTIFFSDAASFDGDSFTTSDPEVLSFFGPAAGVLLSLTPVNPHDQFRAITVTSWRETGIFFSAATGAVNGTIPFPPYGTPVLAYSPTLKSGNVTWGTLPVPDSGSSIVLLFAGCFGMVILGCRINPIYSGRTGLSPGTGGIDD